MRIALLVATALAGLKMSIGLILACFGVSGEGNVPVWVSLTVIVAMGCGVIATVRRTAGISATLSFIGAMYSERFLDAVGAPFPPLEILLVPILYMVASSRYAKAECLLMGMAGFTLLVGFKDPHFETVWGVLAALALPPIGIIVYQTYGTWRLNTIGLVVGLSVPALFLTIFGATGGSLASTTTACTTALWFTLAPIGTIIHNYRRRQHDRARTT